MVNIFLNRKEDRLRVAWRLAIFCTALFVAWGYLRTQPLASGLAALTLIWLAAKFLDLRTFFELGMRPNAAWRADFLFGSVLGMVLVGIVFSVNLALGWVTTSAPSTPVMENGFRPEGFLYYLLLFILVGFYEELLVRGYLFRNLCEGWLALPGRCAPLLALFFTSILFGLMHSSNPNATAISTLNLVLAGFLLGIPYLLTNRLAISIGLHITWNITMGPVLGLPVSGNWLGPSLLVSVPSGPEFWTGGDFGPEGGMLDIIASVLGLLSIFLWVRFREGSLRMHPAFTSRPAAVLAKMAQQADEKQDTTLSDDGPEEEAKNGAKG